VLEGDISDRRIRGMLVSAAREAHVKRWTC
jgi:hypothetical protein